MRCSALKYVIYLILVLSCDCANAGSIAKRQSDVNSDLELSNLTNNIVEAIRELPLIVNALQAIEIFELATNGALGKLFHALLPCTMDVKGIVCEGLAKNGGMGNVLIDVIDGVPSLILTDIIKTGLELFIEIFLV